MTATIPTSEPSVLTAGDTWQWTKGIADYPSGDGWQLTYAVRGKEKLDLLWTTHVTVHSNGRDYSITVPATTTARLPKGTYHWAAYVTLAGARHEVDHGVVEVRPNLAEAPIGDGQTHAERTLAIIEAKLEGRLSADLENYVIAGRSITKIPTSELMKLRAHYKTEVWRERHPGRIGVPVEARFTAPS